MNCDTSVACAVVVREDSDHKVACPCVGVDDDNAKADTLKRVVHRSHLVAYDNVDVATVIQASQYDEVEGSMSWMISSILAVSSLEAVHQYEFSCCHRAA